MLFRLPTFYAVMLDILAWSVIHIGVSYMMTQVPLGHFDSNFWIYRGRRWENNGRIYEKIFRLRIWKKLLPDGAALFKKGFEKKHLKGLDCSYLNEFVRETCRAELTHWVVFLVSPIFFIWNLWWVGIVMIFYATLANMPCIISQRYNRIRLKRVLYRREKITTIF